MLATAASAIWLSFLFCSWQDVSAPLPCEDRASTQAELNQCAREGYDRAVFLMEQAMKAIEKRHRQDPALVKRINQAQAAWIAFRDAEMTARFPHHQTRGYYGSSFDMCWHQALTELTAARTEQLRSWLRGVAEGEACAGSRPLRPHTP